MVSTRITSFPDAAARSASRSLFLHTVRPDSLRASAACDARSMCRGATMRRRAGSCRRNSVKTRQTAASSPWKVLPATSTGASSRMAKSSRMRRSRSGSPRRDSTSYLSDPESRTRSPSSPASRKRRASSALRAQQSLTGSQRPWHSRLSMRRRPTERADIRPLTMHTGRFLSLHARMKFGQTSSSTSITASG